MAILSAALLTSSASGLVVNDTKAGDLTFGGQGCRSLATRSMNLPKGARHLRAVHPQVGEPLHDAATSTVEVATVASVAIRSHREVVTVRGSGDVCDHPEKYPNGWQTDDVLTVEARYRINVAVGAFSDCQHAHVRPSRIIVACGDGNLVLTHMHWTRWGGHTGHGHGTALYNTCSPNCAQGHFGHASVQATLSRPAYCGSEAVYAYRSLVVDVARRGRQRAPFSYLCHE